MVKVSQQVDDEEILRVSAKSKVNLVAGAIAGCIRQDGKAVVQVIGAGALNQAVKAIATARGYLAPSGITLVFKPSFKDIKIEGAERTALVLEIFPR